MCKQNFMTSYYFNPTGSILLGNFMYLQWVKRYKRLPRKMKKKFLGTKKLRQRYIPEYYERVLWHKQELS